MSLLTATLIALLFINSAKSEFEQYSVDRYLDFIIDICMFHRTSAVFFSHAGDSKDDFKSYTLLHSWSRAISRRGLMTSSIPFLKLWYTDINPTRIFNPLFVILLTDKESLAEFSFATRHRDMSSVIWFVIFLWIPGRSEIDYCQEPLGNIFSLTLSTEMMVICQNDVILREWYSLHDNQTKISDLAIWNKDTGLIRLSNLKMHEKRVDMEGKVVRGIIVKDSPVLAMQNGTLYGFFGCLINELSTRMNFTLKIVKEVYEYGTWTAENQSWSGAVDEIAHGRADIALSDFSMTGMRWTVADYTFPVMLCEDCLFIKEPYAIDIHWFAYFQTFAFKLWMALIMLLIVSPLILCYLNVVSGCKSYVPDIFEQYTNVFGIFCQQGLAEYPRKFSLRLAHSTLFLSAFVISAAYSAALICFLTFHTRTLPFLSLEGFIKDGTYKLIVVRGSADYEVLTHTNESLATKAKSFLKPFHLLPINVREAYTQVCNGNRIAFYTSDLTRTFISFAVPCKLVCIRVGRIDSIALMLTKGNPLTRLINSQLQKFMITGIMDHLKRIRFTQIYREDAIEPQRIALSNVAPILAIFGSGFTLCVLMLLVEKLYFNLGRHNKVEDEQSVTVD